MSFVANGGREGNGEGFFSHRKYKIYITIAEKAIKKR